MLCGDKNGRAGVEAEAGQVGSEAVAFRDRRQRHEGDVEPFEPAAACPFRVRQPLIRPLRLGHAGRRRRVRASISSCRYDARAIRSRLRRWNGQCDRPGAPLGFPAPLVGTRGCLRLAWSGWRSVYLMVRWPFDLDRLPLDGLASSGHRCCEQDCDGGNQRGCTGHTYAMSGPRGGSPVPPKGHGTGAAGDRYPSRTVRAAGRMHRSTP
jgi:hypothetical protein